MGLLYRDPNNAGDQPAHTYPIARGFAVVLAGAILALVVLRHLFGSVRLEAGVK